MTERYTLAEAVEIIADNMHVAYVEAQAIANRIAGPRGTPNQCLDGVQVLEDAEAIMRAAAGYEIAYRAGQEGRDAALGREANKQSLAVDGWCRDMASAPDSMAMDGIEVSFYLPDGSTHMQQTLWRGVVEDDFRGVAYAWRHIRPSKPAPLPDTGET